MSERLTGLQSRAECSYCTRSQAVAADMTTMVLHGYQRPGVGYTLGQCKGAYHAHFGTPEGRELARGWAKAAEVEAAHLRASKPSVDAAAAPWEIRRQEYLRYMDAHVREAIRAHTALFHSLPGDILFYEGYARDMNRRVAAWTAQAPVEVKVTKGKLVHWRRGSSYNPVCVRSFRIGYGARNYDCVSDKAKVNCPKCEKTLEAVASIVRAHAEGKHILFSYPDTPILSHCPTCVAERTPERNANAR